MKNLQIATQYCGIALVLMLGSCSTKKMKQASKSMEPTIRSGEVITVDLKAYRSSDPLRWDVVLFESPMDRSSQWCYRVVGLPGEKVEIQDGDLLIDGTKMPIPSSMAISGYQVVKIGAPTAAPGPVSLPYKLEKDTYFVLGDNIANALDSRYWGGLDKTKIIGKVVGK
jgi:signal peptidase I